MYTGLCQKLLKQEGTYRIESIQQSFATSIKQDVGRWLQELSLLRRRFSCITNFWHGAIPTSYFIFFTLVLLIFPSQDTVGLTNLVLMHREVYVRAHQSVGWCWGCTIEMGNHSGFRFLKVRNRMHSNMRPWLAGQNVTLHISSAQSHAAANAS